MPKLGTPQLVRAKLVHRQHLDVANVDSLSILQEYVALDTVYILSSEPILMLFCGSDQESDGIMHASLVVTTPFGYRAKGVFRSRAVWLSSTATVLTAE